MQLNPDCVRDLLLAIEGLSTTGGVTYTFTEYEDLKDLSPLEHYSAEEIEYHLRQCDLSGMLIGASFGCHGSFSVRDISPKAHELLAKVRDKENWKAVKKGLASIRNYSLSAISAIADGVTSAAISAYFLGKANQ